MSRCGKDNGDVNGCSLGLISGKNRNRQVAAEKESKESVQKRKTHRKKKG
jgi:hypothetical protein